MVDGPGAGLALLTPLVDDERMAGAHRLAAVPAHLLEMAGDGRGGAGRVPGRGARHHQPAEQRYLELREASQS